MNSRTICWAFCTILSAASGGAIAAPADQPSIRSHPPLRHAPPVANRPLPNGPVRFVDGKQGDDANTGQKDAPWKTINHAVRQLEPGETLVLRGGVYRENVYVATVGTKTAPVTIRSFPGERAVIDGALAEFFDAPATAWKPFAQGAQGEFRSTRRYRNLRNVVACFGDSMIGLSTYYHPQDLRATSEVLEPLDPARPRETDIKPLYCGPGIWYDGKTGFLHARLSHTHLPLVANYQGETDPRKLPLIVAPLRSVPLTVDGAKHVRFQDLEIRGGGYNTVVVDYGQHIEFDNVTIWCGTYGMRTSRAGPLRFYRSALYGNCPPWLARGDTSKRAYPGRPLRDITRLNTHSHWVIEAGREFSVYAHPCNDHFEVAYSEFTDAHDGPYFGGIHLRFHHNLIENVQDDGIYLSQMYPRHLYMRGGARMELFNNLFRGCLTAIAFGGTEDTRDEIFIYRNLVDLRAPVFTGRPNWKRPKPAFSYGKLIGDHGSPPWPAMNIYHNTCIMRGPARDLGMGAFTSVRAGHPRRAFNNIFLHLARLPGYRPPDPAVDSIADGNLFWSPGAAPTKADAVFNRFRNSDAYTKSKTRYPAGSSTHSRVADPAFYKVAADERQTNDYRLQKSSAALRAGVPLPEDWPDTRTRRGTARPDIGAIPFGTKPFAVGRTALEIER